MPRRGPFRNQRIDDKICLRLEEMMAAAHRRGSLNAYIEEILDKWGSGIIVEVEDQGKTTEPIRNVRRVVGAKGVTESDEGKRKAS